MPRVKRVRPPIERIAVRAKLIAKKAEKLQRDLARLSGGGEGTGAA